MASRTDRHVPRRRIAHDGGIHVNFITSAGVDALGRVRVTTRGSSTPTLFASLPGIAGDQLTAALLEHLHVNGGTWKSSATLENAHYSSGRFLSWFYDEVGFEDLTDQRFTPALAWDGVTSLGSSGGEQRKFRTFFADTLAGLRPDGETHRAVLLGRALPVDVHELEGYAPEVADAIEKVAKLRVGDWYTRHRRAVQDVLQEELPRDWLRLPATALLPAGEPAICPEPFWVSPDDLAAAMVLLALIDDEGPNLSVIQSHTGDSLERAGDHAAFVAAVKARNGEDLRTPAPAGGVFSYGGLLEFVTAATRVERYMRDDGTDFARLLFVATGGRKVMQSSQVQAWWRTTASQWPDRDVPRPERVSFPRMRKAAKLRGKPLGRILIGQGTRTARLYLADAVPDVILVPALLETQNSVTEYWRGQTLPPIEPEQAEAIDALVSAPAVMDVGVAVCANDGQSPTNPDLPCGLGPVACFLCPNGYRTPEVIPGLLAAVEFTDNIRKYEPAEWLAGEAPVLNDLARKALAQFPPPVVAAASDEDVHNARALIACVYLEGRRRD